MCACAPAHRVRSGTGPTHGEGWRYKKGRRREGCRPERRSGRAVAQQETLTRNAAVLPLTVLTVICSPPRESWWSGPRGSVQTPRRSRKGYGLDCRFPTWSRLNHRPSTSTADPWSLERRQVLSWLQTAPPPRRGASGQERCAMIKGFRDFILRGNVIDLAVAVVIGAAFGAVVTAFVADILTPLIAAIFGQPSFTGPDVHHQRGARSCTARSSTRSSRSCSSRWPCTSWSSSR